MKFNLSDCSIVVPIHVDFKERLDHLSFLYSYFDRYFFNHQLIVVELGLAPKAPQHPSVQVEFVKSDRVFSTGEISNIGAEFVVNPFFCKYDVDALVHPKALFDAFEKMKNHPDTSMVLPYNGISFTIQNPLREEIIKSCDFEALPFVKKDQVDAWTGKNMYVKNDQSIGLIHHFRTSVFKALGGYNEEFVGWGYEDNEVATRFEKLQHPLQFLENYNAFHLDHPRAPGDPVQAFKNQYRSLVVKNMDAEGILEYIKTWNRFS